MPSFNITARKTSPLTPVTVDAPSHQEAIQQVVDQAAEGEQIEILQCIEVVPDTPPAGGATGTTGTTGSTGPASRHK